MLSNMVDHGMEPQAALDAPRFSVAAVNAAWGPACVAHSKCVAPTACSQGRPCSKQQREGKVRAGVLGAERADTLPPPHGVQKKTWLHWCSSGFKLVQLP